MSDLKIAVPGYVYQPELNTTQFAILASVNAWTFSQVAATNIATITTTSAHGLTAQPALTTTLPNYFVTFAGNITGQTGVGTLIGNTFRILSIPSTTTFTIYTTVTAATAATTAAIIPVFYPVYTTQPVSQFGQYLNSYSALTSAQANVPYPLLATANCNLTLGANCVVNYYPDNTALILDATTGSTPSTAPVARTLIAASSSGQVWFDAAGSTALVASGTTATSRVSVIS
jgi:hypothetical protein